MQLLAFLEHIVYALVLQIYSHIAILLKTCVCFEWVSVKFSLHCCFTENLSG